MNTTKKPICSHCKDRHLVKDSRYEGKIMCQWCPRPCPKCASLGGRGPFCASTPCACTCHANQHQYQALAESGVKPPYLRMVWREMARLAGELQFVELGHPPFLVKDADLPLAAKLIIKDAKAYKFRRPDERRLADKIIAKLEAAIKEWESL